ncbi:MAG: nitroreductase family protein [Candidatus Bathyarchaeia archaeon]|nr:nitroreductase family protein [Candidatus Bathyarchaeota archaeon]
MDFIELIKSRRSVRKYQDKPISDEILRKLLEAAHWAPSAHNSQPWEFIIIKDEEIKRRIAEASFWGKFLSKAPVGIAIVINPTKSNHPVEDGAAATQNLLLAAHALGLGACWIGSYGSIWENKAKEILGIPNNLRLLSIVAIGYPAEKPSSTRKSLESIIHLNKYGSYTKDS